MIDRNDTIYVKKKNIESSWSIKLSPVCDENQIR